MICLWCKNDMEGRAGKKFCSDNCRASYHDKRLGGNRWAKRNPEKRARIQSVNYYKNKEKYICRSQTNQIFISHGGECNKCASKKDLTIHHEVYPSTRKEIREAIKNKKIYLLCKECHSKITYKKSEGL